MTKSIKLLLAALLLTVGFGVFAYSQVSSTDSNIVSAAAVDYFLKLDGIDGESKDPAHTGEIDVDSWSWGETNMGTHAGGGGGGAGKVSMQDFHFTMKASKASPKLMLAAAKGEHIKEATLKVRKAGSDRLEYMTIKLTDVVVTSYNLTGPSDDLPTESISLNFTKIEFEYIPQSDDGSAEAPVKAGWDLGKNKSI